MLAAPAAATLRASWTRTRGSTLLSETCCASRRAAGGQRRRSERRRPRDVETFGRGPRDPGAARARACATYIVSMTHAPSDLLEVLVLAQQAGVRPAPPAGRAAGRPALRDVHELRARRRDHGPCWRSRPSARTWTPGRTSRRSCSATRTATRTAGSSPRRWQLYVAQRDAGRALAEQLGVRLVHLPGARRRDRAGWRADAARDPGPAARQRSAGASRSPSRARSSSPATPTATSRAATWSRWSGR